jgi:putative endonuclease
MPGDDRRQVRGRQGEQVAEEFLRAQGYTILARNYRVALGEIDLIVQDRQTLVFVEVRTHSGATFGDPLASVNVRKQRQIAKAALQYLIRNGLMEREARFDVVGIRWEDEQARLTHIKSAFELPRSW